MCVCACVYAIYSAVQYTKSSVDRKWWGPVPSKLHDRLPVRVQSPNFQMVFTVADIWSNLKIYDKHCTSHQSSESE